MPEQTILEEAMAAVNGPRRRDYDHPTVNHDRIARLWSAYLNHPVSRNDVVHMMVLLKIARSQHRYTRDNAVDMAGYAHCLEIMNEGDGVDPGASSWSADFRDFERHMLRLADKTEKPEPLFVTGLQMMDGQYSTVEPTVETGVVGCAMDPPLQPGEAREALVIGGPRRKR